MTTILLALLWLAPARAQSYDVDALCRASQTFGMPGVRPLTLPDAPGGTVAAGKDPSVIIGASSVYARSAKGPATFADGQLDGLASRLSDLREAKDAPLPVAIDQGAPVSQVQLVLGMLAEAGYGKVALLTRAAAIDVPAPPNAELAASLRAEAARVAREGSLMDQVKQRSQVLARTDVCPGVRRHVESLLSASYPARCEWLKANPLPTGACSEAQRSESLTVLHTLLVLSDAPYAVVTHPVDTGTLATAKVPPGSTFAQLLPKVLGSGAD